MSKIKYDAVAQLHQDAQSQIEDTQMHEQYKVVQPLDSGYVHFLNKEKNRHTGWKFYVSIKYDDLPKAWDALNETLLSDLYQFKIRNNKDAKTDSNKNLVIYLGNFYTENPHNLQKLITDIEEKLHELEIEPVSELIGGARVITGTKFCHYTFDKNLASMKKEYLHAEQAGERFQIIDWLSEQGQNPFIKMSIKPSEELERTDTLPLSQDIEEEHILKRQKLTTRQGV